MDQTRMPLVEALAQYEKSARISMHIPGHKDGLGADAGFKKFIGEAAFKADVTEVRSLDDLHQADGVIKEAQQLAASVWGANESFFLINGTTSGIIAALTTAASEGDKIIIPRNAHKSVNMAMVISGAIPIYIQPEMDHERGIIGGISPETVEMAFKQNPDAKAIYVLNPTYYGICSDLSKIAEIAHGYGAMVIADEAHGSHLYFSDKLPKGALTCGADISIQSTHKMGGSFTQSSLLHVRYGRVDMGKLKANLSMMQSTSPSYLLMASLDAARHNLAINGRVIMDKLGDLAEKAQKKLAGIDGIDCLDRSLIGEYGIHDFDPLRFIISARKLGLSGYDLSDKLYKDYGIEGEFADEIYCICILGPGSCEADLDKLVAAVHAIAQNSLKTSMAEERTYKLPSIPPAVMKPRTAYFAPRESIPWQDAIGRISAEMIIPYPPGIPVICPGELITEDLWALLDELAKKGRHLHGPAHGRLDFIEVIV